MERKGDYNIKEEIIEGYHRLIKDRYQYDKILSRYGLPESITPERFDQLKQYFLYQMYPSVEKRRELDEAFASLDEHLRHPDHMIRIMIDSASLILKYGRHLPKILKAGFKALQSFRTVTRLEGKLQHIAEQSENVPPYTADDIRYLMIRLPREEIDAFIEDGLVLFDTIYDRELIRKILEIIDTLIFKMKKRPGVYSPAEVKGMQLGLQVLQEGDLLFQSLNPEEQKILIDFIYRIEKDAIEEIFST